jgi:hypothetical protein
MSEQLPKVTETKLQEIDGIRYVQNAVEDRSTGLGWIFRTKPVTDVGIDAEIEMVNANQQATGRLLSVQIKCGPSYLDERTETAYIYRGDREHLNYWIDNSLPVLLILVDPSIKACYWVEVTSSSAEQTKKGWKIEVPFKNILGAAKRHEIVTIVRRDHIHSMVRHGLVRWLYTRFYKRIYVLDIFEVPRDFHAWSDLVCFDDERMVGVDLVLDRYGSFDAETVKESLRHVAGNARSASTNGLILCLVSSSSHALSQLAEIRRLVSTTPGVELYRFLLRDEALSEVLDNDDVVNGYGSGEPVAFGSKLHES